MKPEKAITRLQSTGEFYKSAKEIPRYSLFDRLHAYVYMRWPYLYIGIGKGDHPMAKYFAALWKVVTWFLPKADPDDPDRISFADTYHGKVMPTATAAQLVTIQEDIRIDDLEQVIPYAKARSIVMKNPDHIIALECPCRSVKEDPCLPLDVCLIVGEPFASFAAAHHPERCRWISQEEAVGILEAERDRGHVSHAFFKDAILDRFYAICNCCECCCGAMQAYRNGTPMLASSGYRSQVDEGLCIGCGECQAVCQFSAITTESGYAVVDFEACMGCGVCEAHCEQGAIALVLDERKGIPLEINALVGYKNQTRSNASSFSGA
jgi:Pyruvate/2-oxoacid:ferredoxin oxidoreductase delta subunit